MISQEPNYLRCGLTEEGNSYRGHLLHHLEIARAWIWRLGGHRFCLRERRRGLHEHHRVLRLAQRSAQRERSQNCRWCQQRCQDCWSCCTFCYDYYLRCWNGMGVQGKFYDFFNFLHNKIVCLFVLKNKTVCYVKRCLFILKSKLIVYFEKQFTHFYFLFSKSCLSMFRMTNF